MKKSTIYEIVIYIYVGWLIICSGSQYFRNFNSGFTFFVLLLLAGITFFLNGKVTKSNIIVFMSICLLLVVHTVITYEQKIGDNAVILLITLVALLVLCSNVSLEKYKKYFISFMFVEAIVSLICFCVCWFYSPSVLPGYSEVFINYTNGYNIVYLTPYYTIGWLSTAGFFYRNAGIFWEPGAHAIYLNIALLFFFNIVDLKKSTFTDKVKLVVLVGGILSTLSTTGYVTLVLSFIYYTTKSKKLKDMRRNIIIIIITLSFLIITALYGDVFDKIIYRRGSFGTRYIDTVQGMKVAFSKWVFGYGFFNNNKIVGALNHVGITNISNGLIELMIQIGVPLVLLYVYAFHRGVKRVFSVNNLGCFILDVIFLIFYNSEAITMYPVFLCFFFFLSKCTGRTTITSS